MNRSQLNNGMEDTTFEKIRKEVYAIIAEHEQAGMSHKEALLQLKGFQTRALTMEDKRIRFKAKDAAYKSSPEMKAKSQEYLLRHWAKKLGLPIPKEDC